MKEIWKDVENTDGMYRVSNLGNVVVRDYRSKGYWRPLHLVKQDTGYIVAQIYYDGKRLTRLVHRLVADAFLPNPTNLPVINHKDQNPQNNCVDNLEWCTIQYNCTYADAVQRRAARITGVWKASDPVAQYTMLGEFVALHKSSRDASYALCGDRNKKSQAITNVCRGLRNHCGGYQWRFASDGHPESIEPYQRTDMIEQLTLNGEHLAYYKSSYDAFNNTGVQPTQVLKCCKGQRKQSGGYCWRYYNPDNK